MKKSNILFVLLLIGLLVWVLCSRGSSYQVGTDAEWSALKDKAATEVMIAAGWSQPRLLGPSVNSVGWEDSLCIAEDGETLWFAYIPCDLLNWIAKAKGDVRKFNTFKRGPVRGANPEFAINTLECKKKGGLFAPPKISQWSETTDPIWQSESGLAQADGRFVWNTNNPTTPTDYDTNIYLDGKRLPAPVNTDYNEDDPFYRDGELFFGSDNRPGGMGGKDLWMTRQTPDGGWTEPELLPEPINLASSDSWQCHMTRDGDFFFTSNREGPLCIYMSTRTATGTWAEPKKVIWPSPGSKAVGVAEPTLTDDGRSLYFCILFRHNNGAYDLDIAHTVRD
ncbi:hypothetical protein ACFL1X_13365 [Candidatus Hydrogenedentota bacterium]